jgi:hypothetical protein
VPAQARSLYQRLADQFGHESVYMDVRSTAPGADFIDAIRSAVASCQVFIAVIGPRWVGPLDGERSRLEDQRDWVRQETVTALQRPIRVVPVMVEGARMPPIAQMPQDLQPLARRHGVEIDAASWDLQVAELIEALEKPLRNDLLSFDEHHNYGIDVAISDGYLDDRPPAVAIDLRRPWLSCGDVGQTAGAVGWAIADVIYWQLVQAGRAAAERAALGAVRMDGCQRTRSRAAVPIRVLGNRRIESESRPGSRPAVRRAFGERPAMAGIRRNPEFARGAVCVRKSTARTSLFRSRDGHDHG